LTNHSQLFFLHSTVIDQFLTLTASSTITTAHCRPRIKVRSHGLIFFAYRVSRNQSEAFRVFCYAELNVFNAHAI